MEENTRPHYKEEAAVLRSGHSPVGPSLGRQLLEGCPWLHYGFDPLQRATPTEALSLSGWPRSLPEDGGERDSQAPQVHDAIAEISASWGETEGALRGTCL